MPYFRVELTVEVEADDDEAAEDLGRAAAGKLDDLGPAYKNAVLVWVEPVEAFKRKRKED